MSRVRIVRIIDRLNIGGPAKHVTWLTAGMNDDEFETMLITGTVPPGEGDMSYFAHAAGVEPLVIKEMSRELGLSDLLVMMKLLRLLFQFKPQIIHTHKAKAGAVGRVTAMIYKWAVPSALWLRPRDCRIVHTFHGHTFHSYFGPLKTRLFILIERMLARLCTDRIVTISEQQRREIHQRFGVGESDQFRVIPLGIDFDELKIGRGALRREYGVRDDEILVGIVGRLCEVKNHAMFLEVAGQLLNEGVKARFVIIGGGHLQDELEMLAARMGIAEWVIFTSFRDDAVTLYSDLDVVALTSLNEGTPLTLIEAMGCGRAVVATEVGGVSDLLGCRREARAGFSLHDYGASAPSRDTEAFARALRLLIEDAELRQAMGQRGRGFIQARYSRQRLLGDLTGLYRELLRDEQAEAKAAEFGATPDKQKIL
jgi:glycosyltransferase involved in cell wall biosynthesis